MNLTLSNPVNNLRFQISGLLLGAFFIVKLILPIYVPTVKDDFLNIFSEVLIIAGIVSFTLYLIDIIKTKLLNPVNLLLNLLILVSFLLIIIVFTKSYLSLKDYSDLVLNLYRFFIISITLGSFCYFYLILKELYYFKQKKDVNVYFNTMTVFFLLTIVTSLFGTDFFLYIAFLVVSIMLIAFNSLKISWIAFVKKRDKLYLLLISIGAMILLIWFITTLEELDFLGKALKSFILLISVYGASYSLILFFTALFHLPTAEAFDRKNEEINSLQYFSNLITQVLDTDELAETVAQLGAKITNSYSSWIVWKNDEQYKVLHVSNIEKPQAERLTGFFLNKTTLGSSFTTKIIDVKELQDKTLGTAKINSIAAAPIRMHNMIKGYLLVIKDGNNIYDDEDLNALNTFVEYASVAFDNSSLLKESIEKERMKKELDVARDIQKKLIPSKNPDTEKLSFSSLFIPAFEVGGDYYDFFEMQKDKLGFCIADVSGKGVSAAFIMAEIKGIFEALCCILTSPKELLKNANSILKKTLNKKFFVSAVYGIFDLKENKVRISRAGHCPILLLRGDEVKELKPKGIGLGLAFGDSFNNNLEEIEIPLQKNDLLVLYTDGITEAKNIELEDFGMTNFKNILHKYKDEHVDVIANKVIREVSCFSKDTDQHDDITLVIIKIN